MAGKIFINYRRGDDPGFTQALYQRLEDEFGPDNLFMDVEGHIKPGDDFVQVLDAQVGQADIVLAVIGPRWSDLIAARSVDADDFVAIEIKSAIDRAKRVVPVLVGGALMPRAEALPEAIRALARRNAVGLRPERFKADCLGLIAALKEQLAQAERERDASARERAAAEDARRQREADEAARLEALESRARVQPLEGIDPAQLRKAEELANWQYVGERGTLAEIRDHLARYPGGVTERAAHLKLEEAAWAALPEAPGIEELRTYLSEFSRSKHAAEAQTHLDRLLDAERTEMEAAATRAKETEEWLKLATSTDKAAIKAFLKSWPSGQHTLAAKVRYLELTKSGWGILPLLVTITIIARALKFWPTLDEYVTGWHRGSDFSGMPNITTIVQSRSECEHACLENVHCRAVSFDQTVLSERQTLAQCYQYHQLVSWTLSSNDNRMAKFIRD